MHDMIMQCPGNAYRAVYNTVAVAPSSRYVACRIITSDFKYNNDQNSK